MTVRISVRERHFQCLAKEVGQELVGAVVKNRPHLSWAGCQSRAFRAVWGRPARIAGLFF